MGATFSKRAYFAPYKGPSTPAPPRRQRSALQRGVRQPAVEPATRRAAGTARQSASPSGRHAPRADTGDDVVADVAEAGARGPSPAAARRDRPGRCRVRSVFIMYGDLEGYRGKKLFNDDSRASANNILN